MQHKKTLLLLLSHQSSADAMLSWVWVLAVFCSPSACALSVATRKLDDWFSSRSVASRVRERCTSGSLVGSTEFVDSSPRPPEDDEKLSLLLDFLHTDLMTFSPEADELDDDESEEIDEEAFFDFIVEGRKMLQISESLVCYGENEKALADGVWTSIGNLLAVEENNGLLVALPDYVGDAKRYVVEELVEPLDFLGFGSDIIEVTGYRRAQGAPFPGFRVLYTPNKAELQQEGFM